MPYVADGNGDSTIDDLDFNVWKNNFGDFLGGSGAGEGLENVPEPSALLLFLVGCFGLSDRKRIRWSHCGSVDRGRQSS
jgi:hypothetical protein